MSGPWDTLIQVSVLPEPASLLLLGIGLLALVLVRGRDSSGRRRR
jgi:hypothetical protein